MGVFHFDQAYLLLTSPWLALSEKVTHRWRDLVWYYQDACDSRPQPKLLRNSALQGCVTEPHVYNTYTTKLSSRVIFLHMHGFSVIAYCLCAHFVCQNGPVFFHDMQRPNVTFWRNKLCDAQSIEHFSSIP